MGFYEGNSVMGCDEVYINLLYGLWSEQVIYICLYLFYFLFFYAIGTTHFFPAVKRAVTEDADAVVVRTEYAHTSPRYLRDVELSWFGLKRGSLSGPIL